MKKFWLALAVLIAIIGVLWWRFGEIAGSRKPLEQKVIKWEGLRIVGAYIAMMEKPDAVKVLLADDESMAFSNYFARAGLRTLVAGTGGFDLVVAGPKSWARKERSDQLVGMLSENGVLVMPADVRKTSAAEFKAMLESFPAAECHLWMPGEHDWLLTGRRRPRKLKVGAMLDLFARENTFEDLAAAECGTLPEMFACYVGTREQILPAFTGDLSVRVRPEFFLTEEMPVIDWLAEDDSVDADILQKLAQESRSMQVVRRRIVRANMLIENPNHAEQAMDEWAGAFLRNPHDPMLLDRIYRLAVNARAFREVGNLKGAAKCYETMITINPKDAGAMRAFGEVMKMLGKTEISEHALEKAKEMINE